MYCSYRQSQDCVDVRDDALAVVELKQRHLTGWPGEWRDQLDSFLGLHSQGRDMSNNERSEGKMLASGATMTTDSE